MNNDSKNSPAGPDKPSKAPSGAGPSELDQIEQLKQSTAMFQLVMDNIPMSIFWKDKEGVYLGCNKRLAMDTNCLTTAEIIGKTDYDLAWSKEESDFYRACDKRVMETGQAEFHIIEPQLRSGKKRAWLDTSKIPLQDEDGNVVGILGMYEDITERVMLEKQREDFVATLTHDLKNPLLGTNRVLELLLQGRFGHLHSEQSKVIEEIKESNARLVHLVQNLMDVYKFDTLVNELEVDATDVGALIKKVCVPYSDLAASKQITLSFEFSPPVVVAEINITGIERVVHNLLENALKFTPVGGAVKISLTEEQANFAIAVSDSGPGVSPEEEPYLFNRFWQGQPGKTYAQGTGLGLYVCKQIIDAHGGTISYHNLDQGCLFRVEIPRRRAEK